MLSIRDFGVTFSWQGTTVRNIATLAQEAESLGFGHFWVPEAWGLESFSTTAYLLALTKKIKIGTGVVNVFSRSAALIGMACATLDQISLGRFMLGIGTSGRGLIERWHKAKFERPLCRTLEYIDDIRRVSRGLPIEQSDSEIGRGTFRLFTSPMGKDIEIYLGAIGDGNLKLAGEHADGAILAHYPLSLLGHAIGCVSSSSRGLGEGRSESEKEEKEKKIFAYYPLKIVPEGSRAEEEEAKMRILKNIAFYVASMGSYYAKNLSKLGFSEQVSKIREVYASKGSEDAARAVGVELLEELAFIGTPSSVVQKLLSKIGENLEAEQAIGSVRVHPVFSFEVRSIEDTNEAVSSLRALASQFAQK